MKPKRKTQSKAQSVSDTLRDMREHQTGKSEDPILNQKIRRCIHCGRRQTTRKDDFFEMVERIDRWACLECVKGSNVTS